MKKFNKPQNLITNFEKLIKSLFFTLIFTWIIFNTYLSSPLFDDFFAVLLALVSLLGAVYSFSQATEWGFTKSSVGKSLIFIGFALVMWFLGQSFYYLDSKIENPTELYEFFFILIDPFYLLALYFLALAIGTFKSLRANLSLIILPFLILILNLLIVAYLNNLDFINLLTQLHIENVYIFGSIILATFTGSILIFSSKLGGIYKNSLFYILFGILFQFAGDNLYAYFEAQEINGSLADLLFLVSISLISYGVYKLDPEKLNERRI